MNIKIPAGTRYIKNRDDVYFYHSGDLIMYYIQPFKPHITWAKLIKQLHKYDIHQENYSLHVRSYLFKGDTVETDAVTSKFFAAALEVIGWNGPIPEINVNDPDFLTLDQIRERQEKRQQEQRERAQKDYERREAEAKKEFERGGWVYVVTYAEIPGIYKIGKATDLRLRLASLQIGCPFKLIQIHALQTPAVKAVESVLHKRYKATWVRGEWYRLTDEQIEEIKSIVVNDGRVIIKKPADLPVTNNEGWSPVVPSVDAPIPADDGEAGR